MRLVECLNRFVLSVPNVFGALALPRGHIRAWQRLQCVDAVHAMSRGLLLPTRQRGTDCVRGRLLLCLARRIGAEQYHVPAGHVERRRTFGLLNLRGRAVWFGRQRLERLFWFLHARVFLHGGLALRHRRRRLPRRPILFVRHVVGAIVLFRRAAGRFVLVVAPRPRSKHESLVVVVVRPSRWQRKCAQFSDERLGFRLLEWDHRDAVQSHFEQCIRRFPQWRVGRLAARVWFARDHHQRRADAERSLDPHIDSLCRLGLRRLV